MQLLIATTNLHKIRELKDLLKAFPHFEVVTLHQFSQYKPPEEAGATCRENAVLKAEHAAKTLNTWVLADDSGLAVAALNGQPGVHSARYAGLAATDKEKCEKLLREMEPYRTSEERAAHYECCLAMAHPTGLKKCVKGVCEGYLAYQTKGRNGFGYDPIFIKNDYDKTFGELDETVKNRISHRRKAFERLIPFLESLREQ